MEMRTRFSQQRQPGGNARAPPKPPTEVCTTTTTTTTCTESGLPIRKRRNEVDIIEGSAPRTRRREDHQRENASQTEVSDGIQLCSLCKQSRILSCFLRCGHSFCEDCLPSLRATAGDGRRNSPCPTCHPHQPQHQPPAKHTATPRSSTPHDRDSTHTPHPPRESEGDAAAAAHTGAPRGGAVTQPPPPPPHETVSATHTLPPSLGLHADAAAHTVASPRTLGAAPFARQSNTGEEAPQALVQPLPRQADVAHTAAAPAHALDIGESPPPLLQDDAAREGASPHTPGAEPLPHQAPHTRSPRALASESLPHQANTVRMGTSPHALGIETLPHQAHTTRSLGSPPGIEPLPHQADATRALASPHALGIEPLPPQADATRALASPHALGLEPLPHQADATRALASPHALGIEPLPPQADATRALASPHALGLEPLPHEAGATRALASPHALGIEPLPYQASPHTLGAEFPTLCPLGCGDAISTTHAQHFETCRLFGVQCPHARFGCTFHEPRGNLQEHLKVCAYEKTKGLIRIVEIQEETISSLEKLAYAQKSQIQSLKQYLQSIAAQQNLESRILRRELTGTERHLDFNVDATRTDTIQFSFQWQDQMANRVLYPIQPSMGTSVRASMQWYREYKGGGERLVFFCDSVKHGTRIHGDQTFYDLGMRNTDVIYVRAANSTDSDSPPPSSHPEWT